MPRLRDHVPVGFAVDDTLNETLPWQDVNLDAKPDIIQQQKERAFVDDTTARCDLGLLTPAMLGSTVAPRTVILVCPDEPRTRIDIQLLGNPAAPPGKFPPSGRATQPPVANANAN